MYIQTDRQNTAGKLSAKRRVSIFYPLCVFWHQCKKSWAKNGKSWAAENYPIVGSRTHKHNCIDLQVV